MKCKVTPKLDLLMPVTVWLRFRLLTDLARLLSFLGFWYSANQVQARAWRVVGLEILEKSDDSSE